MPGGRPTTYTPEVLEMTQAYINDYESFGSKMPSIVGLARVIGRARDTIHDWMKDPEKKEFSDMIKQIAELQQEVLFNKGLSGAFNPTIVKLALTKHGYSDKVEQDTTHNFPEKVVIKKIGD